MTHLKTALVCAPRGLSGVHQPREKKREQLVVATGNPLCWRLG